MSLNKAAVGMMRSTWAQFITAGIAEEAEIPCVDSLFSLILKWLSHWPSAYLNDVFWTGWQITQCRSAWCRLNITGRPDLWEQLVRMHYLQNMETLCCLHWKYENIIHTLFDLQPKLMWHRAQFILFGPSVTVAGGSTEGLGKKGGNAYNDDA